MKGSCIALRYNVEGITADAKDVLRKQKRLRRLPHVFSKVLELPFSVTDDDVSITEDSEALYFSSPAICNGTVHARAVEIVPGIMKVVVHVEDNSSGDGKKKFLDLDRWRFRLPPCTLPMMAKATYACGQLIVIVPKTGINHDEGDEFGDRLVSSGDARQITVM